MASSSQNTFDESSDDTFDDIFDQKFDEKFDQFFDQAFENLNISGGQKKKKTPELISKEIMKKGIFIYGMIISVILQRILIIYSDDVFE